MTNQIFINDVELDVSKNIVFPLTYSISDVKEPQKRKRNSSKTIILPGTQINNSFFQSAYDLNISDVRGDSIGFGFDATLRYPCRVLRNGKEIFRGTANLQKVKRLNKVNEFHVVLYSEITNLFQALGDITIAELGWSEYDYTLSVANIEASWANPVGSGVVIPLIDYGFTDDPIYFETNDLRPFVYVKEIIEKCFERSGFVLSGGFFSSDLNKKLIWGSGGGEILTINSTDVNNRLVDYDGGGDTSVIVPSTGIELGGGLGLFYANHQYFKKYNISDNSVIEITENQDLLSQMNEDNGEIVIANSGNYKMSITSTVQLDYAFLDVSAFPLFFVIRFELRIFRNNSKISTATFNINESVGGSKLFDLNLTQEFELESGDIVEGNFYISTTGTKSAYGAGGDLELDISFNSINIELTSLNSEILDGDTVNVSRFLPNMKASDFMQDMITMFNLYLNEPNDDNEVLFVPIDDYYYGTDDFDNWSKKIDEKKVIEIMPAANIQGKTYAFKWAMDRDYFKQLYFETYGEAAIDYGDKNYEVPSTFKTGIKPYQLKIAQSVPVQIEGTNIIIPHIYKKDEGSGLTSPHKGKPRMFFYNGTRASNDWYLVNSDTGVPTSFSSYPVAHHLDDIDTPTFDLNFGVPFWVYYTALSYTSNNLFFKFHAQFIRELTSKDSKILNGFFDLNESDLYENFQRRLVNVHGVLYRKNIVKDFRTTSNETTKVELVKIVAANSRKNYNTETQVSFEPGIDGVGGGGNPRTGVTVGIDTDTVARNTRSSYIADTSNNDVGFTLNNSALKKGKELTFINQTGGNSVIINAVLNNEQQPVYQPTINGSTDPLSLPNKGDSVTIRFDGANYLITAAVGTYASDHHSGIKTIELGEVVTIAAKKQMTNWNQLKNNGTLIVDGDLILR